MGYQGNYPPSTPLNPTQLGTGVVTADAIAANAVTTTAITNNNVTVAKISATGTPSASTYLRGDASWATITGVPSGSIMPYAGSSAPTDWLLCSGAAVSRSTYAALFAVIGTTYGSGDGSTTFNLPDLRGRAVAGVDNMGGTAANRITSGGSGITGTTLGAAGGAETFTITSTQLPSHSHTATFTGSNVNFANSGSQYAAKDGGSSGTYISPSGGYALGDSNSRLIPNGSVSNANTGGGGASNVTQPTMMLNYIIKT